MVELDHTFSTGKPIDYNWEAVTDLVRVIPCVEGGEVVTATTPQDVKARITVRMGAMSMKFTGKVQVIEMDEEAHRAVIKIKSKEAGGQGFANADVIFELNADGGTVHTAAQISGKAASMGEGVVVTVLDALIKDFTERLTTI